MDPSARPFIIPVFLPHLGCPHRCVFCNQTVVTGRPPEKADIKGIESLIRSFLSYKGPGRRMTQIGFYGGNFLGLDEGAMRSMLRVASKFVAAGLADSVRLSTRPDTVTPSTLEVLREFPVSTVEVGAQSMDDGVLEMSCRGHSSSDTVDAVVLLKEYGYRVGVQMMVGLPGEDRDSSADTAGFIADLQPDFVRIYPTLVLEGSSLASWYRDGRYRPLSLKEAVSRVKECYLVFAERSIAVIRMGLQISEGFRQAPGLLAGPYHPSFGHMVYSEVFLDKAARILESWESPAAVRVKVHPRCLSRMTGLNNRNRRVLARRFRLRSVRIIPDPTLGENDLIIAQDTASGRHARSRGTRRML
ncbi:radical SAM protein [Thermodesulfobacteriota bacterium]